MNKTPAILLGLILAAVCPLQAQRHEDGKDGDPKPGKEKAKELFRDVTEKSGVKFTYRNGEEAGHFAILETIGGGVALFDFDGDGLLDIYIPGGGYFEKTEKELYPEEPRKEEKKGKDDKDVRPPPKEPRSCKILGHPGKLYRNLGNFKFEDVTEKVMPKQAVFYSHGCAVADYDNDGWPDLLVTGYGRVALYHNEPADPKDPSKGRMLVDRTEQAGLKGPITWATSAAWADLDGDGLPDLYVCQYVDWSMLNNPTCAGYSRDIKRDVCPPKKFKSLPHFFFRNNGDGTFTDVSAAAGLIRPGMKDAAPIEVGKGKAVVIADFDGDGKPDIYVANDTTDNFLYRNETKDGAIRLKEIGEATGTAGDDRGAAQGSMGADVGDPYRTGLPSIFVTSYEGEIPALYRNLARKNPEFSFDSLPSGIAALGQRFVGHGVCFLDVDHDGWEDMVISHGHVIKFPTQSPLKQKPVILRNQGKGKFKPMGEQGGSYFTSAHHGRGLAVGDLDNDGRPDLVISHLNEPVAILRNEADTGHHWLGVELIGKKGRDVTGARVTVEVGDEKLTRFAKGGGSCLSASDRRLLFGLGKTDRIKRITVAWPWGQEQQWDGADFRINRYSRLTEK